MRRGWKLPAVAAFAVVAMLGAACSGTSDAATGDGSTGGTFTGTSMNAAGATFPDPVYELWFRTFTSIEPDAEINYQAIGSGGGIEQLQQGTVDFGASDAPLQDDEIETFADQGREILQFPTVLGGVAVAYNVPEIGDPLALDGSAVAGIFLGTITRWDDPAIA
ncbi:MAG: extracellular solute-binding protein, partial [Candidatus Velamenicoccus archaeovorus]